MVVIIDNDVNSSPGGSRPPHSMQKTLIHCDSLKHSQGFSSLKHARCTYSPSHSVSLQNCHCAYEYYIFLLWTETPQLCLRLNNRLETKANGDTVLRLRGRDFLLPAAASQVFSALVSLIKRDTLRPEAASADPPSFVVRAPSPYRFISRVFSPLLNVTEN